MNRKIAIIGVIVILASLVLVLFFSFNGTPNLQKIAISNFRIDLGVQTEGLNYGGLRPPIADYTIKNLNSIDVTNVSLSVDGIKYGPRSLVIPSGHSVITSTVLINQTLSTSTTYNIEFAFIFEDKTYETYSTSYTTPESR
jgi:hypothetical protein